MYSTIVVGTDGSATARAAAQKAAELAAMCGATLHLVHGCGTGAVASDGLVAVPIVMTDDTMKSLEAELEQQADELRSDALDVKVHVVRNSGSEAVLTCAEEQEADLIVVGNQGMSGKRRFILGSVPNAVSHHAPCSVLIVHTT